jgi:hypothetical protein
MPTWKRSTTPSTRSRTRSSTAPRLGLSRSCLPSNAFAGDEAHPAPPARSDEQTCPRRLPVIDPKDRIFFRDIYDHLVRLHDLNESLRDLVGGALDTYLSVINNRMNEVMKTLTIITTLFMPLTFVTGFFGMNFFEPLGLMKDWTTTIFLSDAGNYDPAPASGCTCGCAAAPGFK